MSRSPTTLMALVLVLALACRGPTPFGTESSSESGTAVNSEDGSSAESSESTDTSPETESSDDSSESDVSDQLTDTGESTEDGEETGAPGSCPDGAISLVLGLDGLFEAEVESQLDPMIGIECLDGNLVLSDGLLSLAKLSALETVTGSVYIGDSGFVPHSLQSLAGLESLTFVGGNLIVNSVSVTSVDGLDGLLEIGQELHLRHVNLEHVDALGLLTHVGGNIYLGDVEGGGTSITQVQGFSSLVEIGGGLEVLRTSKLSSLAGFENLQSVQYIVVVENSDLVDVTPVGGGDALLVPGPLVISDNEMLPTCNAWELADTLNVLGEVDIQNNLPDGC